MDGDVKKKKELKVERERDSFNTFAFKTSSTVRGSPCISCRFVNCVGGTASCGKRES